MTKIAIIGGGLSGKLAALYFEKHLPKASITMIDPNTPGLPVVGESTVEVTCQFLTSLGLGPYMEENHLHKYGLTYYFRLPGQDSAADAPEYVRHESPGVKRMLAYNLNRHTFDEELTRRLAGRVTRIEGKVQSVDLAGGAPKLDLMDDMMAMAPSDMTAKEMSDDMAKAGMNKEGMGKGGKTMGMLAKKRQMLRFADAKTCGSTPGPQMVNVTTEDGDLLEISADHVIDCSGRARVLTKQLELEKTPPYQRCSYWFRLAGFDRSILTEMNVVKDKQHSFDSYYVTHHFYGKGYWIWVIPMKSDNGESMVSMGITYRPEVSGEKAMNFDRMLAVLDRDHPSLARMVRSGRKVDDARYFNYMYEAHQYYDREGRWFLLGDSAFTFDPANSAGIAYLSVQIPQITSMIKKAEQSQLSDRYVDALEGHVKSQLALQDEWSRWYDIMDDPVKMAWTLTLSQFGYFTFSMPNYLSGAVLDAGLARQASRFLMRKDPMMMDKPVYPFPKIMDRLAMTDDPQEIIRRIPSLYEHILPFNYFRPENVSRGRMMARYLSKSAWLRVKALHLLRWWQDPACYRMAAGQYGRSALQVAAAGLLTLRPQLWDRAKAKEPDLTPAFEPASSFLFPDKASSAAMTGKKSAAAPSRTSETADMEPALS